MFDLDTPQILLMAGGAAVMTIVTLRSIAGGAMAVASNVIVERRALEEKRHADNAEAEAAGRAAALEPLSLNPDGSIEEPIIGVVETQ
jgi:hypothetical protein